MRQAGRNWGTRIRTQDISGMAIAPAGDDTQTDAHNSSDAVLAAVLEAWPRLSGQLRTAVLAIVKSVGSNSAPVGGGGEGVGGSAARPAAGRP